MTKVTVRSPVENLYNPPSQRTMSPQEAAAVMRIIDGSKQPSTYDVRSLEELNDVYRTWALQHPNPAIPLTMPNIPDGIQYPTTVMFQQLPTGKVGALFVGD
ncbi:hypothetical protein EOM33_06180 [Candidatus Saccharibacteria bacterium]|nr:hypothetical protein [Candidatus Saccharibacteria bacterium]